MLPDSRVQPVATDVPNPEHPSVASDMLATLPPIADARVEEERRVDDDSPTASAPVASGSAPYVLARISCK